MGISHYLKEIGRGKDGARALDRTQAADLMGQLLDGQLSDLEIGAFCLAMRIKGETADEMAGFLDAIAPRLSVVPASATPTVVLPCYNGARKLPALTPLLALLLARQGLRVVLHGQAIDPGRVTSHAVLETVVSQQEAAQATADTRPRNTVERPQFPQHPADVLPGPGVNYLRTEQLSPALQRLLDVRRVVGLRNSAHSLVKLLNPCAGAALVVSSYTHPEYLHSMGALLRLTGAHGLLLRGTEGEPVADARRTPRMDLFANGNEACVQAAQEGSLASLPELPPGTDAQATAVYIDRVLNGELAVPSPIACQVQHIVAALTTSAPAADPSQPSTLVLP